MQDSNMTCHICHRPASLKSRSQIGYQEPHYFAIYHCEYCHTAFCDPLEVDSDLYETIYQQAEKISGYRRYVQYAEQVIREGNPLGYLSASEDVYWAIEQYLKQKNNLGKILEIGSGFGYLTYALSQKGFDIRGLDISHKAVEQAKKRYGDLYVCADIVAYCKAHREEYDTIIFTEVIEHIPNLNKFLQAIHTLLKPCGECVLTTPNRTPYPDDILWETEPPPVHLWWFSEKSIKKLAKQMGYKCRFIDFSEYNLQNPCQLFTSVRAYQPTRLARLDAQGQVLQHGDFVSYIPPSSAPIPEWKRHLKQALKVIKILPVVQLLKKGWRSIQPSSILERIKKTRMKKRRSILCAILKKKKYG